MLRYAGNIMTAVSPKTLYQKDSVIAMIYMNMRVVVAYRKLCPPSSGLMTVLANCFAVSSGVGGFGTRL